MPIRLQKIDEHTRPDHSYLDQGDECYYVFEYTPRQQPPYDDINDLVFNLKKPVDRKGKQEYFYKERDIRRSGDYLRSVLNQEWLPIPMLVPVPCSKIKGHPLYDDRVLQIMQRMTLGLACNIRELVVQTESLESFHGGARLAPYQLRQYYRIDEAQCQCEQPPQVAIFDDMLTTGSHFKAMKSVIQDHWPNASVCGIFIARRYIPHEDAVA